MPAGSWQLRQLAASPDPSLHWLPGRGREGFHTPVTPGTGRDLCREGKRKWIFPWEKLCFPHTDVKWVLQWKLLQTVCNFWSLPLSQARKSFCVLWKTVGAQHRYLYEKLQCLCKEEKVKRKKNHPHHWQNKDNQIQQFIWMPLKPGWKQNISSIRQQWPYKEMRWMTLHCCESETVTKSTCEIIVIIPQYCSACILKRKLPFQLQYMLNHPDWLGKINKFTID